MSVATARLRRWVWLSIYGGMAGIALGLSVRRGNDMLGWTIAGLGAAAVAAGIVMIRIRSRIDDPRETP